MIDRVQLITFYCDDSSIVSTHYIVNYDLDNRTELNSRYEIEAYDCSLYEQLIKKNKVKKIVIEYSVLDDKDFSVTHKYVDTIICDMTITQSRMTGSVDKATIFRNVLEGAVLNIDTIAIPDEEDE